ncbi:emp24/gp25L/p24 family/GOLD, putative [Trypanosoma equiperdum]|uniref:GOLD domain-containing protein n=4 Tax=Trypanozoon TaxID=39700 RepID=Q57U42_TRYB2|nr:hypothetical protein, conserved [Trypanosoma brucei gambiense DAL972]XP_847628.1 hypothetical protein, conserved [Trypanosoma brucei brucei TREU927]AAX70876.1 hypothetical protein, conserved [Trypanosoma brucei]RHW70722.1 emp24/gp25L/p24 family/GOLD [Trypanosoma brucei equiperdum]SCU72825.1 emp24/gp25L/p24 family/GOLD, putative [Trypanosoma equiperdum]AAZ13562.1 hypothetical protein, conserved [Trypanosoma brucei brucei TREU927]CBH13892.1 hypothetical protein, conserved [Trypanosoma brucei|eukprot:XP_011776168.1 hypothetical protein, conserved [Trypanosoma brucei gambiense DAL972]
MNKMHILPPLLVVTALLFAYNTANAVTTAVAPREVFCVREVAPPHTRVTFQFNVMDADGREIRATLHDQNGTELTRWDSASTGNYDVPATVGATVAHACFENTESGGTPKRISFHFRFHVDYQSVAGPEALDPVESLVESVAKRMRDVEVKQKDLQAIQHTHLEIIGAAEWWLMLWSLFQVASLLLVSVFQLLFLKRFLERKSFV